MHTFTSADLAQMQRLGIRPEAVQQQLQRFITGFPPARLVDTVRPGRGITRMSEEEMAAYTALYEKRSQKMRVCKFVPASGAASRMFRKLYQYADSGEMEREVEVFFERLHEFAFYEDLVAVLGNTAAEMKALRKQRSPLLIRSLLEKEGLGYGHLPKLLLKFHRYPEGSRSALEEHLVEGALYAASEGKKAYLHFTLSPQHQHAAHAQLRAVLPKYEQQYGLQFEVTFSTQNPATNTLAVDMNNQPFRLPDGSLLFRPGGHGALLENLQGLQADLVFIKNVDNLAHDRIKAPTCRYKRLLGGLLLQVQQRVFGYLTRLDEAGPQPPPMLLEEIDAFLRQTLCILPPPDFDHRDLAARLAYYRNKLHRPLRVCGIVRARRHTGGGPFWAQNPDGSVSLQLIEIPQIDQQDEQQKKLLESSAYANITDLVCGLRDYRGKPFDLMPFRDEQAGFITHKSLGGRSLKALELPGLWNGAMAGWNTLFAEVPRITFNPVKSVMDLLEEGHLGE
ncbi:MAG: DUF4301 family protein [Bacteroidetes bacterium]|nr:MAG: DUF4301 family protein [Bacteroidota bacterium]